MSEALEQTQEQVVNTGGFRMLTDTEEQALNVTPAEEPVVEPEKVIPPAETTPPAEPAKPVITDAPPLPDAKPVVAPSEQAVLADKDPLEALGFTDNKEAVKKVLDAYKSGKLSEYIDISSRNYDAMPDEQIVRQGFDSKYASLTKEERDILWQHEISTKYNITGDEEADKFGLLRMKADASETRNALKQAQADYVIPEYKATAAPIDEAAQQRAIQEQKDNFVKGATDWYKTIPAFQAFETNKMIRVGDEATGVNYEAKNVDMLASITNPSYVVEKCTDSAGNFDAKKWQLIVALANDPDGFIKTIANHYTELGEKKIVTQELKNGSREVNNGSIPEKSTGIRLIS